MATYPTIAAGRRITATLLRAMQPDRTVKTSATARTNNTLSNDPELAGIALAVGTWDVYMLIFVTAASATPDLKTQWSFTGTWNNALRLGIGPGPTNTAAADAITPYKSRPFATNADSVYGLASSAAYTGIQEMSSTVTVTVAGNLALSWAQNTTDANATTVQPGSYIEVRQIAA